jgi:hypothetical protein
MKRQRLARAFLSENTLDFSFLHDGIIKNSTTTSAAKRKTLR